MVLLEPSEAKPTASESQKNLPVSGQEDDGASPTAKFQVMPDLVGENIESSEDEDRKVRRKKFKRNEIEYAQHLKAKFFSNKNFTGVKMIKLLLSNIPADNVFEEETKIEDEIIRSSRWPCTSAFADPAKHLEEKQKLEESSTEPASSVAETSTPT